MTPLARKTFATLTVNLQGMTIDRRKAPADADGLGRLSYGKYAASPGADRLFAMLRGLGLRATVFVPGQEALDHPDLVRAIAGDGHEIAAHGFAHEDYAGAPGEKALLERTHEILYALVGTPVAGWRAPTGVLSEATLGALDALGYCYDSSNQDDDFPYRLRADGAPRMIELPQAEMLIDATHYGRRAAHEDCMAWWREEFDAMRAEGCYALFTVSPRADSGSGRASRVAALRGFLAALVAAPDIVVATCAEAVEATRTGALRLRD